MKIQQQCLIQTLKDYKEKGFITLLDIVCTDLTTEGNSSFLLTYTLFNPVNYETFAVETMTNGIIDSVTSIFKSANYDEREIFDLFGLHFSGHPNLKRLFMSEDFKGHPMLNAYKQEDLRLKWNS